MSEEPSINHSDRPNTLLDDISKEFDIHKEIWPHLNTVQCYDQDPLHTSNSNDLNPEEEFNAPFGLRTIQSVVTKITQRSLSFFHVAGMSSNVVSSGPSISNAMDNIYNSDNTSMSFAVSIRYQKHDGTECKTSLNEIKEKLVGKKLEYFVDSIQDNYVSELDPDASIWYKMPISISSTAGNSMKPDLFTNTDKKKHILRFNINFAKLIEFNLSLHKLATICFGGNTDVKYITSPDFIGIIDLYTDTFYTSRWISILNIDVCGSPLIRDISFQPITDINATDVTVNTIGSEIITASKCHLIILNSLVSNHVKQIESTLGIEAAAKTLRTITTSPIISDFMTRNGRVYAFNNNSIEVSRKGMLTSLGFERPRDDIKRFITSNKEIWDVNPSIYSDIMIGANPQLCFDVLMQKKA